MSEKKKNFSIIMPVYNENNINAQLDFIAGLKRIEEAELIIVDGENTNSTITKIDIKKINLDLTLLNSEKGRANQMNFGTEHSNGDILIFLHADTKLPKNALSLIEKVLEINQAGAFDITFDSNKWYMGLYAKFLSFNARLSKIPLGDQTIFIQKSYFNKIGKYTNYPLFEDVDLMRKIKRKRGSIKIIRTPNIASSRKWEKDGFIFVTLRSWFLSLLYYLGVSPVKLVNYYYTWYDLKKDRKVKKVVNYKLQKGDELISFIE